jgi:hypothetical protein
VARELRLVSQQIMLTRATTWVLVGASLCVGSGAFAGGSPIRVKGNNDGVVSTTVTDRGRAPDVHAAASTSDAASSCTWTQVYVFELLPLPASPGGIAGAWWQQYCRDSGWRDKPVFVPSGTPPSQALLVSPGTLAQRAVNRLQLPEPRVGLDPRPRALVNLPEWFWVPRADWPTLRQRTHAGAVWAVVVARPVSTTWDPGDGSPAFTCAGPGTPYDPNGSASAQRTNCSYTYTRSSASQPQRGPDPNDRFFTVTVTTTWQVTWVGAGGVGGSLPALTRSTSFALAVAEREAVVTGGSG